MRLRGQPRRQQHRVRSGQPQRGPQQRVPDRSQAEAARVGHGAGGPQPEPLVLERVRRQLHPLGTGPGEHRGPVQLRAAYEHLRRRDEYGLGLRAALPQHRRGGGLRRGLRQAGQYRVGSDLQQPTHILCTGGGLKSIVEADRPTDLIHPVVSGRPVLFTDRLTGDRTDGGEHRLPVGDARGDVGELRQHRLHQRRVKGMTHPQPRHPTAPLPRDHHHPLDRILLTGDDHRGRPVDRRDRGPLPLRKPTEDVGDLGLLTLDRRHRTTRRQPLHQPRTTRHQPRGIPQPEHTRHIRRDKLADRVAQHHIRPHAPRPQQLHQRHLHREQRRLRIPGPLQQSRLRRTLRREQHLPQRVLKPRPARQLRVQVAADLIQDPREHRELAVQLTAHTQSLAPLPREHPARTPIRHHTGHHRRAIQVGQTRAKVIVGAQHHRAVLQGGARRHQRKAHVDSGGGPLVEELRQTPGLCLHRPRAPARQHPWHHRQVGRRLLLLHGRFGGRGFFDDDVRVRPADAERRNTRAARTVGPGPGAGFGQQPDRTGGPVHMGRRLVGVQRPRQPLFTQRQHHLDDAGHTRRALRVADVRLHRAEPQRIAVTLLPVGGHEGLCLDGVAEPGSGAVRLDGVHLGRRDVRGLQCLPDHALLGGAVRRAQPVRRAVLVDRATAYDRQHVVSEAPRVGQPLQHQHAGALGPSRAVRRFGEGLAPAVPGQPALTGELQEHAGVGHDRGAARERHRALPGP